MVGGSSRIPLVQREVEQLFGRSLNKGFNPDEVVSAGAAIQAGILEGDIKSVTLLDVTNFSLGIEVAGGRFATLIPKNTTIPAQKTQLVSTVVDNQRTVKIHVLQGEEKRARDNVSLGDFELRNIQPAPKGDPRIRVKFGIDASGIVSVSARDMRTGIQEQITIASPTGLSTQQLDRMKAEAERDRAERRGAGGSRAADRNRAEAGHPGGFPPGQPGHPAQGRHRRPRAGAEARSDGPAESSDQANLGELSGYLTRFHGHLADKLSSGSALWVSAPRPHRVAAPSVSEGPQRLRPAHPLGRARGRVARPPTPPKKTPPRDSGVDIYGVVELGNRTLTPECHSGALPAELQPLVLRCRVRRAVPLRTQGVYSVPRDAQADRGLSSPWSSASSGTHSLGRRALPRRRDPRVEVLDLDPPHQAGVLDLLGFDEAADLLAQLRVHRPSVLAELAQLQPRATVGRQALHLRSAPGQHPADQTGQRIGQRRDRVGGGLRRILGGRWWRGRVVGHPALPFLGRRRATGPSTRTPRKAPMGRSGAMICLYSGPQEHLDALAVRAAPAPVRHLGALRGDSVWRPPLSGSTVVVWDPPDLHQHAADTQARLQSLAALLECSISRGVERVVVTSLVGARRGHRAPPFEEARGVDQLVVDCGLPYTMVRVGLSAPPAVGRRGVRAILPISRRSRRHRAGVGGDARRRGGYARTRPSRPGAMPARRPPPSAPDLAAALSPRPERAALRLGGGRAQRTG